MTAQPVRGRNRPSGPPRLLKALAVRNFRLFAGGQVLSVIGTWMMVTAQDWLVLRLTDDSASALGTVTALQFTPILLLALHGGRLADRYDKRRLLQAANLVSAVLAALLALAVATGEVRTWHIYACALGLGTVNAVEIPVRMSFVTELVGAELLPNASALSAAYFNIARVAGPAVAGVCITHWGTAPVMAVNALSYGATVGALALMRPAELHRQGARPGPARVRDGLRYVLGRRDLVLPLGVAAAVGTFGFAFPLTLPLLAKTEFHTDAASFGLLSSALAAGSLPAALVTAGRRGRPGPWPVVVSAAAFGALETACAFAPTYGTAVAVLFCTGFAMLYFAQAANHRIQLGAEAAYRGRVLALYILVFQGSTPLGALLLGRLADDFGVRSALAAGGAVSLLAAAVAAVALWRSPDDTPTG
ncbi:MFS transporter [Streptomyces sp. NPDC001595]|uniref:MFS transporter n=1 Tax=Streptomyces sp. NPDC001532 TaxID=3154520 RepID=UPI00332F747B